MSARTTEQGDKPGIEIIKKRVYSETRDWFTSPSGYGFFTVDRAWGQDLIVAYYSLRPGCGDNIAVNQSLSDWKGSSYSSRDKKPTDVVVGYVARMPQTGFVEQWSETVHRGNPLIVDVWRGNTPVEMIFENA